LEQGKIDVLPEYLGTALTFVGLAPGRDRGTADLHGRARDAFSRRGISVLAAAPGQDQNGIAVATGTAERLHLTRVSELARVAPTLVFGGPAECPERPLCLQGLKAIYGLQFRKFEPLDSGGPVTIGALETAAVDVAVVFTSDGHLGGAGLRLLVDDRGLQPPENLLPMVRSSVLRAMPARARQDLDRVSARLTTGELVAMNRRVQLDGASSSAVATAWLRAQRLS
jgi:osmoprotectant transport system substrate-binding protein